MTMKVAQPGRLLDPSPLPTPRVAIVGTGALGSAVCRLLLMRGHAHVLLVDPDAVAPRNLVLSALFQQAGPSCVGRAKVAVIQELARLRGLVWEAMPAEIADVGLARLARYDVLISCPDSSLARVETAFAARTLRLPMLDGAVQSKQIPEGRVSWFAPAQQAACSLCGLSENRRGELLAYALAPSLGCMPPAQTEPMSGGMASLEAVAETLCQVLAGEASRTSYALRLRVGSPEERVDLSPSPTCPWHGLPHPDRLVSLPEDQPVRASLWPGSVLELPWPVCLRARCLRCGLVSEPRLRTARVRRTLPCPGCGGVGCLEPQETVEKLTAVHPLTGWTPRQLGLPEEHLYHRRRALFAKGAPEPNLP